VNNNIKIGRAGEGEGKKEKTQPIFADRFGGITDVTLTIRLPTSYWKAIQLYAEVGNMTPSENINEMVISMVESTVLAIVNDEFHEKFHLGELSSEDKDAMVRRHRSFKLSDVTVSDEYNE
jgi:hypothetical protein